MAKAKTATSQRIKVEYVKLGSLHPAPYNPRIISDAELSKLERSMDAFGVVDPIIARRRDGMVIGGHQRLEAARRQGIAEVPVVWLDDLSDEQAKTLNLALNRISGEWDMPKLGELLEEMSDMPELDLSGFDVPEMSKAITAFRTEQGGLTDDDAVPEAPEPTAKLGDLWLLGDHRLLGGDATKAEDVERLLDGVRVAMMFTDPPYGVGYDGGHFHSGDVNIKRPRETLANDDAPEIYERFLSVALLHVDGPCYMWFADVHAGAVWTAIAGAGGEVHALLIWNKINATYAAMNAQYKLRHEPFVYFKPKGSTLRWMGASTEATVWDIKREPSNDLHPTQKPLELAERAIANHDAPEVYDPFLGSGTTLIACEKLGRRCYGMEIEPRYVDVAVRRWEEYTGREAKRP